MAELKKIRVGVLFGGRSSEHEISLRSALTVMSAMVPARYEVVPIGIGRDGRWYLRADAIRMLAETAPRLEALAGGGIEVSLLPHPAGNSLVEAPGSGQRAAAGAARAAGTDAAQAARTGLPGPLDVVFPVLHGSYGEDGTVQGLLELAGIPYVGAGVLGSAVGMDKDVQKRLLREAGLPVVRYAAVERWQWREAPGRVADLARALEFPVFVKPNALGSSIGISKVKSESALGAALEAAFAYDRKVLIEAACAGRELECAVLGNERPEASTVGEIIVKGRHEFYSYESKYIDPEGAEVKIPAALNAAQSEHLRELACAAFRALGLCGMARVDFLARPALSEIYVNEVNTIPGFTAISMYPKLWEASGLPLGRLIDRLIELALEEHRERAALKITYEVKGP
ncbi:MAG TPA: D-alanine--D-alanine ligase family protein [Candidatus Binataceae bacterium]|nr:D-alanine--D-alanine ligase family protein [Candidatus Binataceae bacterium]